ncbi:MAG: hypothetical protein B7Z37_27540 [Verrucomicrobia bacterium 12-59-8]|nr:MAG: hypothetical protein B7Z37_27540 [Verrucomicrobia bacterium 12-59-8]
MSAYDSGERSAQAEIFRATRENRGRLVQALVENVTKQPINERLIIGFNRVCSRHDVMDIRKLFDIVWFGCEKAERLASERAAQDPFQYYPVSVLVRDPQANLELHEYLLKGLNTAKFKSISANGITYEVGVINLDPAPTIPPNQAVVPQTSTAGTGS